MIILEIVIALAFIFFLLSILVSGLNEAFALLLNKRGRELQRAIGLIFDQLDPGLAKDFYRHPLVKPLAEKPKWDSIRGLGLHIINFFRRSKYDHNFPPSYIDRKSFSRAMSDVLVMGRDLKAGNQLESLESIKELYVGVGSLDYSNYQNFPDMYMTSPYELSMAKEIWDTWKAVESEEAFNSTKKTILVNLEESIKSGQLYSASDEVYYGSLKTRLLGKPTEEHIDYTDLLFLHSNNLQEWYGNAESWFDKYMDRVSGWYKRRAHTNIFWISLVIVCAFNLDAVEITKTLFSSEQIRMTLVNQAASVESIDQIKVGTEEIFEEFEQFLSINTGNWSWSSLPGRIIIILATTLGAP